MTPPTVPVGFDYARALLKIREKRTYEQIAEFCGYGGPSAISHIIAGSVPSHPQGEAIFVLYRELFGEKPPMTQQQSAGSYDIHQSVSLSSTAPV